jgi:cytochrome c peroxidase
VSRRWIAALTLSALGLSSSCRGDDVKPSVIDEPPSALDEMRAAREPRPTNLPARPPPLHPSTREGIELGRRLFFDPRMSGNDRVSCATCHDPARAFTDGVALSSAGVSGHALTRNSPTLANLAWAPALFWDGGAKNLESLMFGPILHEDEMAENAERLAAQLEADPEMRSAFERAFPGTPISPSTIMRALAQYVRSLVSADSRYDRYARGNAGGKLSPSELRGLALHRERCASCHATDLFTDQRFHDIGLDVAETLHHDDPRRGRARVTASPADERAYRTPTLRNLSYTAPYMHDGRFATLDQVFEHYRDGVHHTPSLAKELLGPDGKPGIPMTDAEESDLRAFLLTLDDPAFLARHRAAVH